MRNLTITLDERVYQRLKERAEREQISMSKYVSQKLEKDLSRSPEEVTKHLMETLAKAAESAKPTEPWKWNREEIYEW